MALASPADAPAGARTPTAGRDAVVALLLLRRDADVPATAPPWVLPSLAVTMVVFLLGLIAALGGLGLDRDTAGPALELSGGLVAGTLAAGVVGRLFAVLVQAEAACTLAGPSSRERRRRKVVLVACLLAQVPTALRDLLLGVAGLSGLVSTPLLLRLTVSPFDPFLLWSCLVFCVGVSRSLTSLTPAARRGLYIGFFGYAYCLKLALFGLGALAFATS